MPLVDLPLEELRRYKGVTPVPDDFDDYWNAAIEEMHAIDPQVSLVPADFSVPFAECYDLYFTGIGGSRIHAKYLRPKHVAQPHPAVLEFHGYFDYSGPWNEKLNYVSQGFSLASMDVRGQAGESEDLGSVKGSTFRGHIVRGLDDAPEKLLFRSIYLDAAQLARILMSFSEIDPDRIGVVGRSQGGGIGLACAALEPRISRIGVTFPFLCDFKRVWQLDLAKDSYVELLDYFCHRDPLHLREDEIFTKLGYIDVKNLTRRIRGKVLMGTGLMDTVVPPSTQFAAYNQINSEKNILVYPDYGHFPIPHFADARFQFLMGL